MSDIEGVISWYSQVLGFQLIGEINHIKRAEDPSAGIFKIKPPDLNEVKIAYLATGNEIGFELSNSSNRPQLLGKDRLDMPSWGSFMSV